jgi:hypothetical protein
MPAMPFKANAKCRHHIPKRRRRLTNWPAYEAGLRQRGDLTVWFSEKAIVAWRAEPRTSRGGQSCTRRWIQTVQPGAVVENKRLGAALALVKQMQDAYPHQRRRYHPARQRPPNNLEAPGMPSKSRPSRAVITAMQEQAHETRTPHTAPR